VIHQLQVRLLAAKWNPLDNPPWSHYHCPEWRGVPITREDIEGAFRDPELEVLGAGTSETWTDRTKPDNGYCNRRRHILRIAWLVLHRDDTPIGMNSVEKLDVYDGWHRLAAAIYRGDKTIAAIKDPRVK
jgi:hypothetical protein